MSSHLPTSVTGDKANTVVMIDGMFALQTLPLAQHKSVMDYVAFMVLRWVKPMFTLADNVHLVWDHPGRHGVSPKTVERQRRDTQTDTTGCDHAAAQLTLTSVSPSPEDWRKCLSCRVCKRALVGILSCGSLLIMKVQAMDNGQTFVTAGGFNGSEADNAWFVNASEAGRHHHFQGDHEECDTRVWFSCSPLQEGHYLQS